MSDRFLYVRNIISLGLSQPQSCKCFLEVYDRAENSELAL
jgi:hypothetical protein